VKKRWKEVVAISMNCFWAWLSMIEMENSIRVWTRLSEWMLAGFGQS